MGGVVFAAYRDWAKQLIYSGFGPAQIEDRPGAPLKKIVHMNEPAVIVLVGWSWIVPPEIYNKVPTLCLHPSPLPRYRGGSPLQHQIMAGEHESAVTIFRVQDGPVDCGPIYGQCPISLAGSLENIFDRIVQVGAPMLRAIVDGVLRGDRVPVAQPTPPELFASDPSLPGISAASSRRRAWYIRRTPEQSELSPERIAGLTSDQLRNFIRALDHPDYPRAFIYGRDGLGVELSTPPSR